MIGLGGLANIGMALYGMYQTQQGLNQQKQSMADVNNTINGGKKGEVASDVEGTDKLSQPGENYLKTAGNLPKPKTKGLGFDTNNLGGGESW